MPGVSGRGVLQAALLQAVFTLLIMKIIHIQHPLAFIGTVFVFSWLQARIPVYQILSGGLILGAFFMATDYVTTPITTVGKLIFGIGCGIITCVIRFYANYPEGVSFSILLMNIATPYIDLVTRKKPVGAVYEKKEAQR